MEPNDSDFDLDAFIADTLPALAEVEAADSWRYGYGEGRDDVPRPATALLADDSPIARYLNADPRVPEELPRPERAALHEQWRATRDEAVEAARDAAETHSRWVEAQGRRAAADSLDAMLSRAQKARDEKGSKAIPVRSAERPADIGRW